MNDENKSKTSKTLSAYHGRRHRRIYSRDRNLFSPGKSKKRHLQLSELNNETVQGGDGPHNLSQ